MIRLLNVYESRSGFFATRRGGARIQSNTKIWFYAAGSWEAQSCLSDLRGSAAGGLGHKGAPSCCTA